MYHFENKAFFFHFFNLGRKKKLGFFEKVTRKFNGSSSKIIIYFFFLKRFGYLDFLFLLRGIY